MVLNLLILNQESRVDQVAVDDIIMVEVLELVIHYKEMQVV